VLGSPFPGVIGPDLWSGEGQRTYILDGHHRASALYRVLFQDYDSLPGEIKQVMTREMQAAWQADPGMHFKVGIEKTFSKAEGMVLDFLLSGRGQLPAAVRNVPEFARAKANLEKGALEPGDIEALIRAYRSMASHLSSLKNSPLRSAVGNAFFEAGIDSVYMINYMEFITGERLEDWLAARGIVVNDQNSVTPELSRELRAAMLGNAEFVDFLRGSARPGHEADNRAMLDKALEKYKSEIPLEVNLAGLNACKDRFLALSQ
jgi:hypothetical protein